MKTNILRFVTVAFAAVVMCSVPACEDPIEEPGGSENNGNENTGNNQEVAVNFPDLVENYEVKPGETLELTFTPSKEWTVSVPSETIQWFWIADGSFKLDKFSGTASEEAVTVKIGVSGTEEFDTNRSCDVTLTIGDESKVIAKYMRPAKERTLAVYMAELSETGDYKLAEDGVSYVYGAEATSSVTLVWSAANADFRAPIRVESNGEWTAVYPEWMTLNVPEKTTGVVELVITGESLESASGKISFKSGDNVIKEVEVSVPSCKGVDVYSASVSEGEFEYDENGEYSWTDKSVSEVTLAWLGADFRMPLKISSKCNWTIECPEWIEDVQLPSKTAGEVSIILMGNPTKYPLIDTEGKIRFKNGTEVIHEITVVIPGCKDIMSFGIDMALTELAYNAEGLLKTSTGYVEMDATGKVFGTEDIRVFAIETTGGNIGNTPAWFNVSVGKYVTSSTVLQERTITFKVDENTGYENRSAVVFFLPPSIQVEGQDLFSSGVTVKDDYVAYSVAVSQLSSVYDDYLMVSSADDGTEYEFVKVDETKKNDITNLFDQTAHVYSLTYKAEYSRVWFDMAVAFDSFKVFSADDITMDKSADENFWLKLQEGNETNTYGAVSMYMGMELPTEASTGYIVFYDKSGTVLAIIECVSPWKEEEITPPDDDESKVDKYEDISKYLVNRATVISAGAELKKLISGPTYDSMMEEISQGAQIWYLTLPSLNYSVEIKLPERFKYYQMPYLSDGDYYISVNGENYRNTRGQLTSATDRAIIKMNALPDADKDYVTVVRFHLSSADTFPFVVLFLSVKE